MQNGQIATKSALSSLVPMNYSHRNVAAAATGPTTAQATMTTQALVGTRPDDAKVACRASDKAAAGKARDTVRNAPGSLSSGKTMPPSNNSTR